MADRKTKESEEKTIVKGLCFIGVGIDSNTIEADVKDSKLIRIKFSPLIEEKCK